ncbi:MAG: alpha/beta hydrolase [bacterium]
MRPTPRNRKNIIYGILLLLFGYLLFCLLAFFLQRQLIYHPLRSISGTPGDIGLTFQEHLLSSPDGVEFPVWEIPSVGNLQVVFFHGNAENISQNLDTYQILHDLGATVWAVEYRGYLTAGGTPSETAIGTDLQTLSDFLNARLDREGGNRLIVMGRSLGGAVAAAFAAQEPCDGLILESTFTSIKAIASRTFFWLPVGLILRERYDTESRLEQIDCPILVVHSRDDGLIPFSMGESLAQSAKQLAGLVEISGPHNGGFLQSRAQYVAGLESYFAELRR